MNKAIPAIYKTVLLGAALFLLLCGAAVQAEPLAAHKGPEQPEKLLRDTIGKALKDNAKLVVIPPGVYRLKADPSGKAHLLFENVSRLTINAQGVTLIMTETARVPMVAFYGCDKVRVIGLSIDCDPLQFTQGKITAADPQGAWYDLQIDPGFRTDIEAFGKPRPMSIFDPGTREWKLNVPDIFIERLEAREAGVWRVHAAMRSRGRHPVEPGDPAVIPFFSNPGITCRDSSNMTFENVTVYQSGSMAFHEHAGGGNTVLRKCRVTVPEGTGRLLSTNADGFHCKNQRQGPLVEDCLFERMHDDGINIHGTFGRVLDRSEGSTILWAPKYKEQSGRGDLLEFFSRKNGASSGVCKIKSITQLQDPALSNRAKNECGSVYGFVYRVELTGKTELAAGDGGMALSYIGSGFRIRNNTIGPIRYRGLLLRGHDGIVSGNTFRGCANDAISVTPELFSEGCFMHSLIIRKNTIIRTGMLPWHKAAIRIDADNFHGDVEKVDCREHSLITIEDNVIDDVAGHGIFIAHAQKVLVKNNRIMKVGDRRVSANPPSAIRTEPSADVKLESNTVGDLP